MPLKLLLGSQSPRRRELLAGLGVAFSVVRIDADESYPASLQGEDIPIYISRAKAAAYADLLQPDELLITADTIVWLNGLVLGKPHDEADARRMLRLLSGQTHQVFTGVTLTQKGAEGAHYSSFAARTDVCFRALTEAEIVYYVSHFHPLDKAGSYGIQEWIGCAGISGIRGSFYNVMGLPLHRLYTVLRTF